jgi:opacity protein-like surface antigen
MKYSIMLAAILSATSFNAMALDGKSFGSIEYAFRDYDGNVENQNGINLKLGREVAPGIKIDGVAQFRRENGTENTSNRLELGGTYELGNLFVRGAVGRKFASGYDTVTVRHHHRSRTVDVGDNDAYSYYAIEPGIKFNLTNKVTLDTTYRYRDTFDSDYQDQTHRVKVGAKYSLTKDTALTASVARSWGDKEYNSFNVGYAIKF